MFLLQLLISQLWAVQTESLGNFNIQGFSLSSVFTQQEPAVRSFQLERSYLSFVWQKEASLKAYFDVGTSDLVPRPIWYSPKESSDLRITKAMIEAKTGYVNVLFGLIPLRFGFAQFLDPNFWYLPSPQINDRKIVVERDYGLGFVFERDGYYAQLSFHNGEAGNDEDGRMWVTSSMGYFRRQSWGFNLSGQTGYTEVIATSKSTAEVGGLVWDPNSPARLRMGEFSVYYVGMRYHFLALLGQGQSLSDSKTGDFRWIRIEALAPLGNGDLRTLIRVEENHLDLHRPETRYNSATLGLSTESEDRLAQWILAYTANFEKPSTHNDEIRLSVRLSSEILSND